MICRLCLCTLSTETAVQLFNENQVPQPEEENNLIKMIANYLYLELSQDDAISTHICQECCTQLKNFNRFWQSIEQKQNTLANNSQEINCDVHWADEERENILISNQMSTSEESVDKKPQCITPSSTYIKSEVPNGSEKSDVAVEPQPDAVGSCSVKRLRSNTNQTKTTSSVPNKAEEEEEPKRRNKQQVHKENEEIVANYMKLDCPACDKARGELGGEIATKVAYRTFSELRDHFSAVHKIPPYVKCCDVVYSRLARLVEHVRWHQNPEEFTCHFCRKVMRSKVNLQNHIKVAHNNEYGADIYPCTKCELKFVSEKRLETHLLRHNATKLDSSTSVKQESVPVAMDLSATAAMNLSTACETCGLRFNSRNAFEQHLLEHQLVFDTNVQCTTCDQWFYNQDALQRHQKIHNHLLSQDALEPAEFNDCNMVCENAATLHTHVRNAHKKEKKFSCQYCEKSFKLSRYLQEHIATHTREKLHTCPHCPTEFRCKSNMYAHIKRKHQKEWRNARELKKAKNAPFDRRQMLSNAVSAVENNHIDNNNSNSLIDSNAVT